ncbi:MAG TPA: STAS domain-containing protein [Mycobacteriales bacterium]|nr:STAS domain-containing protein [Mycobacteriales bacterium]
MASAPTLRMTVDRSGPDVVLRLIGEADIATADRLRGRLRDLVAPGRPDAVRRLVVDASQLSFLDLVALDALLAAAADVREREGVLVLRAPTRRVRRLLSVLSIGDRLPVVPA